jgi:ADP-heptose:LPS heptosyltransferase
MVLIAGLRSKSRQLSLDQWMKLIVKWHRDRPFLISGAPQDAEFVAELTSRFKGLATGFKGSFEEWCEQISRSEEIFAMDGDGVQIASFYGVPTLAIFTSSRDNKWHPLGAGSRLLRRHDLRCQPCAKFGEVPPCPNRYACLKLDDIEPVNIW